MNTTTHFFNAVSSGNTEAVKAYHAEYGKMPLNTNLNWINGRIIRLPLIIAFYEGHIETARYLWENGADLDIVCRSCGKTPREFMPEGFENGSCRMMSYKVFRDRVYQAMLDNQSYPDKHATLIRLQKHESCVQEMYERATDEDLFRLNLHGRDDSDEKIALFRQGRYFWNHILESARMIKSPGKTIDKEWLITNWWSKDDFLQKNSCFRKKC